MGNTHNIDEKDEVEAADNRYTNCDINDGLILSQHYIPEEVLVRVLSFVDEKSLAIKCRLVCRKWRDIIETRGMRIRAERRGCINLRANPSLSLKLNWIDYYWLNCKNPIGRNLLINNCGQDGLRGWTSIENGGDGWIVESNPAGSEGLPPINSRDELHPDFMGLSSCYATSYRSCSKEQLIKLDEHGFTDNFLDTIRPPIQISEWTSCRFDCGSVYELNVALLDKNKHTLVDFQTREDFSSLPRMTWHQVTHVFHGYSPGVRYVRFWHRGKDSQFWKGFYGSKISGGSVRIYTSIKENSWGTPSN